MPLVTEFGRLARTVEKQELFCATYCLRGRHLGTRGSRREALCTVKVHVATTDRSDGMLVDKTALN
eukprot:350272-Chlamydomonas_euryale.AAC.7